MAFVSIIVPCSTASAPYLSDCVSSLLSITEKDIEIVLVLQTRDLVVQADDARIRIVRTGALSAGEARNFGVKNSCGDYITFVDADDTVDADYLDNFRRLVALYNFPDLVIYRFYTLKNANSLLDMVMTSSEACRFFLRGIIDRKGEVEAAFSHNSVGKFYKRSRWDALSLSFPNPYMVGEDMCLFLDAINSMNSIVLCPAYSGYHYRSHPNSIMTSATFANANLSLFYCMLGERVARCVKKHEWHDFPFSKLGVFVCNNYASYLRKFTKSSGPNSFPNVELVLKPLEDCLTPPLFSTSPIRYPISYSELIYNSIIRKEKKRAFALLRNEIDGQVRPRFKILFYFNRLIRQKRVSN